MTPYGETGVVLCLASAVGVGLALLGVIPRIRRLTKRAGRLVAHPVATQLQSLLEKRGGGTTAQGARLRAAAGRLRRANDDMARACAAAARLGLDIDRIAFAVRLLLDTLALSLRESLPDRMTPRER